LSDDIDWFEEIRKSIPEDLSLSGIPLTGVSTLRAWDMMMDPTMVTIQFPEPEGHWHYKWRMFKNWLREIPHRIRARIFPYYIVSFGEWKELMDSAY